jgi:hypothetical protein
MGQEPGKADGDTYNGNDDDVDNIVKAGVVKAAEASPQDEEVSKSRHDHPARVAHQLLCASCRRNLCVGAWVRGCVGAWVWVSGSPMVGSVAVS